jgi:peptide/nickel transport system substrate-binding protein
VTHRGRGPGWWRSAFLCSVALGALAALVADYAVAGASTTTTTTAPALTYVGVAGRSISFGMTQSPSGCNPHTTAGDTPATQLVLNAVLPSPFIVGAAGKVEPNSNLLEQNGAEVVSTTPETIVYSLNPKAVWSDGRPITAADFIYAWTQQRGDPTSDPTTVASTAGYRDIKSVKGSNRGRTVTVVFKTPFADWEMLFSDLLPAHVMEKAGWNPSCTTVSPTIDLSGGPFKVAKATAQSVVLLANPKWWGTKPNSRRITVEIAADSTQLAQWVRTNQVQVALPSDLTPAFLDQMTSLPDVQSQIAQSGTILEMEMASGPDSRLSPDVRFAIALSVDRQALTDRQADWALSSVQVGTSHIYAQGQSGYQSTPSTSPTTSPANPAPTTSTSTSTTVIGQGGAVNFPATTSPTQANALMVTSGYSRVGTGTWHNDFAVPLTLKLAVDEGDPWAAATASQLQSQLESAGFTVSLTPAASAAAAGELLSNGSADLALLPQTSSPFLSETLAWYSDLLGAPGQDGSENWSNYDNHTFNSLVTKASQQLSPPKAATEYQAADVQLWDDVVALPLFTEPSALISNRRIGQVTPTPTNNNLLWYAQYWDVRVAEPTGNTTPTLPGP